MTLVNEQKYLKQEFDGNHKSSRSHVKWYSASGRARIDYANMLQIMEMKVQDEALYEQNQEDDGFTIERINSRLMPYED